MEWLSHQKYMVLWDAKVRYEKSEKVTSLKVKKKKNLMQGLRYIKKWISNFSISPINSLLLFIVYVKIL